MNRSRESSMKWQRYEVKYLIGEVQAAEVRRYCRDYLSVDAYAALESGCQYPVTSFYLDSTTRELLRHTIDKQPNRFKLRVRVYNRFDEPREDAVAFFEVKRRINAIIQKDRLLVGPGEHDALLWNGRSIDDHSSQSKNGNQLHGRKFFDLRARIGADPVLGISYTREAYETTSADRVRVTLDRDLHYGLLARPGNGNRDMWWPVEMEGVVLELKFTNTYPFWVANMLRRLEVVRRGVCKYVICSRAAGVCAEDGGRQRRRMV